jgi:hypothetical protein
MSARVLLAALGLSLFAAAAPAPPASARVIVRERVVVRPAPPPLRREVIARPPGPRDRYVWDRGHWRWTARGYDWVPGRWIQRPRVHAVWVSGRWVYRHGEWVWIDGRWR